MRALIPPVALTLGLLIVLPPPQFGQGPIRRRIQAKAKARVEAASASNPPVPQPAAACGSTLNLGFHIQVFSNGLRAAVWYPTKAAEALYEHPTGHFSTALAQDAPVADCQTYPLVIYSHGFGGCGTVSLFYTEALARAGYIVAAPDHKDSKCKVDQPFTGRFLQKAEEPFQRPEQWGPSVYQQRRQDIRRVLDELPRARMFQGRIDPGRIGGSGHSLGGYTIAAMIGAWSSWRDDRIKAAVLMSPYVSPFLVKGTLKDIHVPVMYQGGTRDLGITPYLRRDGGAYDQTNAPKFFVDLELANHLDWSNLVCGPYGAVPACIAQAPYAREIDRYAIAFFDRYLKGIREPLLDEPASGLADYRHADP
ncbi:MAG: hypothetical protein JO323_25720 [Acidobacteriia bacterium]|nr:hypothetical protein [Terriglobia bacterium]